MGLALLKALSVIGLAGTKFLMGVALCLGMAYSFWPAFLLTFFGGISGFAVFWAFSHTFWRWHRQWRIYRQIPAFSRFSRTLVKIRQSYGLPGIAVLTPVFLTVPVGAFMAASLTSNKKQIALQMGMAFLGWSLLLIGSVSLLGINLQTLAKNTVGALW